MSVHVNRQQVVSFSIRSQQYSHVCRVNDDAPGSSETHFLQEPVQWTSRGRSCLCLKRRLAPVRSDTLSQQRTLLTEEHWVQMEDRKLIKFQPGWSFPKSIIMRGRGTNVRALIKSLLVPVCPVYKAKRPLFQVEGGGAFLSPPLWQHLTYLQP